MLSVTALTIFPIAFPQVTYLITGLWPEDKGFRQARQKFLDWLAERVQERGLPRPEAWDITGAAPF
jgi:hypothetical protein